MYHEEIAPKGLMNNSVKQRFTTNKCNIIAEIGINHGGKLEQAFELICQSKRAGCWGVKFQFRNVDTFYKHTDEVGDVLVYDELKKNSLSVADLKELGNFAKKLGLKFGVSFFRLEDLAALSTICYLFDFFKVPSAECFNEPLVNALVRQGKRVFVSTGGANTQKVSSFLHKISCDIIPMHCVANYPTMLGAQNLAAIETFFEDNFSQVGYSSHDENWEICLIALSKGVSWIERHITLNKNDRGLDHSSSSVPQEFSLLVNFANSYQKIIGNKNHSANQGELINLQNLGTSLYAKSDFSAGSTTNLSDYDIKAPRTGISVGDFVSNYENQALISNISKGESLALRHFSGKAVAMSEGTRHFARQVGLGLPVRLHDYSSIKNNFDINTYEFHLSFSEVLSDKLNNIVDEINKNENISIHLPDYIPNNRLLDPVSRDLEIKTESKKIIDRVSELGTRIEDKIGKKVHIVGSFSCVHNESKNDNLDEIFEFISSTNSRILPQWLPVNAWYFGGTVKLNLFNSEADIDYLVQNNLKICLDVSHLVMSASFYSANWKHWYEKLSANFDHLHISDAGDSSSEGLMFGEGIIGDFSRILASEKLKIIECWQGHMNGGYGFQKSLQILEKQYRCGGKTFAL